MNTKLASQIPGIVQNAAESLQKLAGDNLALLDENEALRHELRATKLAHRMEERGFEPTLSHAEKVAALAALDSTKIATMEGAVELAAGGFSLGRMKEDEQLEAGPKKTASAAYAELDNFIMNGAG